jgi:hypothetical protein
MLGRSAGPLLPLAPDVQPGLGRSMDARLVLFNFPACCSLPFVRTRVITVRAPPPPRPCWRAAWAADG